MPNFIIECRSCGAQIECTEGIQTATCRYCGSLNTVAIKSDISANLYNRANYLRRTGEFDKAIGVYEEILNKDHTDAEAHWGIVLCRYGIEYVEDPTTKERIPTCHRAQYDSIYIDPNYKEALDYASSEAKQVYESEASRIDKIQKGILALAEKEEKYDVFICYKESDASGNRTLDSVLAQEVYYELAKKGYKVFYARKTLAGKLGSAYEPVIFAALNSARVMVIIGTKAEHLNSVWVKNEWGRYRERARKGDSVHIIPAYREMSPYDLPQEFSNLQALDMSRIGFIHDLMDGIEKLLQHNQTTASALNAPSTSYEPLLKRAYIFLEDGDFKNADTYLERVLDQNPEEAAAYIGKLLIQLQLRDIMKLSQENKPLTNYELYNKALRFASEDQKRPILEYNRPILDRIEAKRIEQERLMEEKRIEAERQRIEEERRREEERIEAERQRIEQERRREEERIEAEHRLEEERIEIQRRIKRLYSIMKVVVIVIAALTIFVVGINFAINQSKKASAYKEGIVALESGKYVEANSIFAALGSYKDSEERLKETEEKRKASAYKEGIVALESGKYIEANSIFAGLGSYKDSEERLKETATHLPASLALTIPNSGGVQLKMKLIPAGTFMMGSPANETDRYSDEGPQHQVTFSKAFYIGAYEVTQAQWAAVMGTRPSRFGYNADYPVEQVSWDDCQNFIAKLNTMGIGKYRLPTEAEWEYACRAGSTTRFPWGDDQGYTKLAEYAWYDDNSNSTAHLVGQKKPNAWGLYDMHGNVWEWCSDWHGEYNAGTQTDPRGLSSGSSRVIRGGSWNNSPQGCRSANRDGSWPPRQFSYVGFRLVRTF